jgi:hypothetical protein
MDHLTSFFPAGRDRGVTVAVEGFFAFVWFGWGQAAPPSWLVVPLAAGGGLAVLLTVAGVVLTMRSAGPLRVMSDRAVRRRYSIIVGLEFGLLGVGAAVLGAAGQDRWIPVWICAGVGVHFFPLASTLANRSLRLLGVLLIAVAAAALATGLASGTAPSTVTGAGAGLCLLAFGVATLLIRDAQVPRVLASSNTTRGVEGMDGATVPVAVVTSRAEAELIVGMLRNNGLRAAVSADDAGEEEPQLQLQGVRVLVAPSDEAPARRLIAAAGDTPS